uniref:PARP-type domain-containing protein n=1 Tax=Parastrongyloides trichosuri TaxID=131310 RepID=A0A0N4ZTJ2_PARTI
MSRAAKKNRKVVIDLSDEELEGPVIQSSSEDDFKVNESSSDSEVPSESEVSTKSSSGTEPSPVKKKNKKTTKIASSRKNKKNHTDNDDSEEDAKSRKRKHSKENKTKVKKEKKENIEGEDDDGNKRKSVGNKVDNAPRAEELPFAVEYAKTGRATCKHCNSKIDKDELKLCTRFPSPFFDGYQEQGFHFNCFFNRASKVKLFIHNFKGFDWINEKDQNRIKEKIAEVIEDAGGMEEILKEYVPSVIIGKRAAKCAECKEPMEKDEMRISCKNQNFHPACYKDSSKRFFKGSSIEIHHYNDMNDKQREILDGLFPKVEIDVKKEDIDENEQKLKEQAKLMNELKKQFERELTRDEIKDLLEANGHTKEKRSHERNIKCLIELALFGVPENCKKCGSVVEYSESQVKFVCRGKDEDQIKCDFKTKTPNVTRLVVPDKMKESNEYLATKFKPRKKQRVFPKDMIGAE